MGKSNSIAQTIRFKAGPGEIYDALMDSKKHSAFTGSKCVMGKKVGDSFSSYDGYATGKNLELVQGKKIVQFWRASDWPPARFSEIVFEFKKAGSGTVLKFTQRNLPQNSSKEIALGWKEFYWEPLKKYFETNGK